MLKERFSKEKRWVLFRIEERKGKKTKIPYSLAGKMASSTDAKTWATYDEVKKYAKKFDGIGIVFTPEQNLLGIDIDHVIADGKILKEFLPVKKFIDEAETYTELSPSKEGVHLFFELTEPLALTANKHAPFEAYTSGRYFTVTENPFGKIKPIRKISAKEALEVLQKIGYPWTKEEKVIAAGKGIVRGNEGRAVVPLISDSDILDRMFRSRNGKKIESLYNGDLSNNKGDASSADLSLCSHFAFWTGRDATMIERLWLSSPLGAREKTQKRQDYRERTIRQAIRNCKEIYETQATKVEKANPQLDLLFIVNREKDKVFIQNTENICRILRGHPEFKGVFRYDEFKNSLETSLGGKWRNIEDNDAVIVQTRIQILFPPFNKVGKLIVYDAIVNVAKENAIDSAADYLRSLKWDGKARLNSWISKTYGTENDEYHQTIGANWMKGLVQRVVIPGSKFDYVLVLEGKQGIKKSTSLLVIGGEWHVETTMSTDNKDFFMQFQGKAIIEFSEGETLSRTEVKRMKAIITMQSDKYRPPYERNSQDFPRRCVFAMTTNQDQYLKDETGNRRWLPVAIKKEVDIEWLKENREQLFAEAYHRVINLKETTYEFPQEELERQQELRQTENPQQEQIYNWYWRNLGDLEREAGITTRMAYIGGVTNGSAFGKEMGRLEEMVISSILRDFLKLEKRRTMDEGARFYRYYPTEEAVKLAPKEKTVLMDTLFPAER
jgi:hypothetical protein